LISFTGKYRYLQISKGKLTPFECSSLKILFTQLMRDYNISKLGTVLCFLNTAFSSECCAVQKERIFLYYPGPLVFEAAKQVLRNRKSRR